MRSTTGALYSRTMIFKVLFAVILVALSKYRRVESLVCLSCANLDNPNSCNTSVTCNNDETCFHESVQSGQTKTVSMGCANKQKCGSVSGSAGSLVGRDLVKRQDTHCYECCSSDLCNEILCAHRSPATCIDDETIDCSRMSSVFGICKDIHHAKSLCPKFCGLCNVVDGMWTEWTPWSVCDVTCEDGTQSRSRTCTNPTPANGGLDCIGNNAMSKQCQKQPCPIHGGWSEWTQWDTCSVSCETGMQTRQRTCTNPVPQLFGNHCFGLNVDSRLCMPTACTNGGWSYWASWGSCSVTCGGGFHTRSRTCTNPRPSPHGTSCDGDPLQVGSCNNAECKGQNVAFRSKDVANVSPTSGQTIVFHTISLNEGNGYDRSTGVFTAPVAGTYLLSVQLCVLSKHYIFYEIVVDNVAVEASEIGDTIYTKCYTGNTVANLNEGSHVLVKCTSYTCFLDKHDARWSTFSGVLLHT